MHTVYVTDKYYYVKANFIIKWRRNYTLNLIQNMHIYVHVELFHLRQYTVTYKYMYISMHLYMYMYVYSRVFLCIFRTHLIKNIFLQSIPHNNCFSINEGFCII